MHFYRISARKSVLESKVKIFKESLFHRLVNLFTVRFFCLIARDGEIALKTVSLTAKPCDLKVCRRVGMEHFILENDFNLYKFGIFSLYVTASLKAFLFIVLKQYFCNSNMSLTAGVMFSVDGVSKGGSWLIG